MKKLLITILSFCCAYAFGQATKKPITPLTSVDVYINSNQCYNCNIALQALNYLGDTIQKNVFISESNRSVADEMLGNYKAIKNLKIKYYSTVKSPFRQNGTIASYCIIKRVTTKLDSFELKDLYYKSSYINALAVKPAPEKTIALPDSIKFSDRINAGYASNYYNIYDYTVNKNVLLGLDKNYKKINSNFTVRSKDFNPQLFLRSGIVDTAAYRIFIPVLNYLGKTETRIDNFYVADSCLNLILNFPCPVFIEKGDTGVGGQLFLYKKNLKTLKSQLLPTPIVTVIGPNKEECFINNITGFYTQSDKFYFSMLVLPPSAKTNIIGEYDADQNKRLAFTKFAPYQVSDSVYTDFGRSENNFATTTNSQAYFAQTHPYFIPIGSANPVIIKELLPTKAKNDLWIQDVCVIDKRYLKVLYTITEKPYILMYAIDEKKIISRSPVSFSDKTVLYTLKFIDPNMLIGMKKGYRELAVIKLN